MTDLVSRAEAPHAQPLLRAAFYFDIFNGEMSNGGAAQYFYNQGTTPGFEHVATFVAEHPALVEALPFVQQVHAVWDELKPEIDKARAENEWPEALFDSLRPRFEALEKAYYLVNHEILGRLHAHIIDAPEKYFAIEPIAGVPAVGIAHVVDGTPPHRLRFENGFPVGPNILDNDDGSCDVVWFSRDRKLLETETGFAGTRTRNWIHAPSQSSGTFRFKGKGLESYDGRRSLWTNHGVSESYATDGSIKHTSLSWRGKELIKEHYFPNGGVMLRSEVTTSGEVIHRYWPNGKLNTRCVLREGRTHYTTCLDANGVELAPNGTGRLHEALGSDGVSIAWREGTLVDGFIEGDLVWWKSAADGSNPTETGRKSAADRRAPVR